MNYISTIKALSASHNHQFFSYDNCCGQVGLWLTPIASSGVRGPKDHSMSQIFFPRNNWTKPTLNSKTLRSFYSRLDKIQTTNLPHPQGIRPFYTGTNPPTCIFPLEIPPPSLSRSPAILNPSIRLMSGGGRVKQPFLQGGSQAHQEVCYLGAYTVALGSLGHPMCPLCGPFA